MTGDLVIYATTKDGEGKVTEYFREPLEELYNGELEIPIRVFRADVVLTISVVDK
jgi:hypothetical protein